MPPATRFLALDVFRGMTVCFMIIVNTPGNWSTTFSPLLHANWHGFTPTDLVFPSFLFAVGNAVSFVMGKWEKLPPAAVFWKIIKRTIIIFLLGYLMYWFPFVQQNEAGDWVLKPISETRIPGVLQRIALCYGLGTLMIYFLKPKASLIIAITILMIYWPVMYFFGDAQNPYSLTGNAALRLDKLLLGEKHLYKGEGIPFDPEGILSTFPAIANVIGGYFVGRFVQKYGNTYEVLTKLLLSGFVLLTIAYFWDLGFPINKKLWTSSYVMYAVGLDCIILSVIIYALDIMHTKRWTYFFEVFGRNPLFIYLLSEILAIILYSFKANSQQSLFEWTYRNTFGRVGGYVGSLLFALSFMMICWLVGWWLDKRKIYIKV